MLLSLQWTDLGLGEARRKAENREESRKMVARSFLMPQWSFRLRDERERDRETERETERDRERVYNKNDPL